jgi:hypothetical protein
MAILLHAASTGNVTPFYGLADPEVGAVSDMACRSCIQYLNCVIVLLFLFFVSVRLLKQKHGQAAASTRAPHSCMHV